MTNERPRALAVRFLVEIRAPALGFHDLADLSRRADAAARETVEAAGPVRFIRAVSVPADGSCLLVFEGPDAEAVEDTARRACLEFDRLTPVIALTPELTESGA